MTIHLDAVMPLMLDAVPSFEPTWREWVEAENAPDEGDEGDGRLTYLDAHAVVDHVVAEVCTLPIRRIGPLLSAFLGAIERLHVEGDDAVRELATIGYLEGLQGSANRAGVPLDTFEPWLGPESARWWRGVIAFWERGTAGVQPVDEPAPRRRLFRR